MFSKPTGTSFDMPESPSEVQVSLHCDLNSFGWYSHGRRHHLAGDLRTRRQSPKQKITGTGTGTSASDSLVGLGLVDGASDIDRACHRNIRLPAFCPKRDVRGIGVTAVLLFQRLLKRSKIHSTLILTSLVLGPAFTNPEAAMAKAS